MPEVEGLSPEDAARWRLQATLMMRLPQACATAFRAVDADAQRRWPQRGGSTATLAVACGWELLVANVGDSCAYLDTGSEVLQVGGWAVNRACPGACWGVAQPSPLSSSALFSIGLPSPYCCLLRQCHKIGCLLSNAACSLMLPASQTSMPSVPACPACLPCRSAATTDLRTTRKR